MSPASSKDEIDAIALAAKFKKEILDKKPHQNVMRDEIRMNTLKVKPYAGDLFQLNMANPHFISSLWGLLKLEEYVTQSEKILPDNEIDLFFRIMHQYRQELQVDINKVDLRLPHIKAKGIKSAFTMEIFRELPKKKKRRIH